MNILIVNNNMEIGGIQKSLVNLLNEIHSKHKITLFLFNPHGKLMSDIPKNVRVISGNRFTEILGMSNYEAKRNGVFTYIWRTFNVILTRVLGTKVSFRLVSHFQKIRNEFDVSISYMQNSDCTFFYGGCNEFVLYSTNAKKKAAFVHCDFLNYLGNNPYNISLYNKFDKIACVSDSCRQRFDTASPAAAKKSCTIHNCYDFFKIKERSCEYTAEYTKGFINIFTAARISNEKGILRMIPIFSRLNEEGYKFIWRIAGDGPQYEQAQKKTESFGLKDKVIFLGMLENPYPYFKSSDMLLVPSYDEAAPMVFGEAMCLGTPVLTTDTTSAYELVAEKGIGWVCKNNDDDIENYIRKLLDNSDDILSKKKNVEKMSRAKMSNSDALAEFEDMLLK